MQNLMKCTIRCPRTMWIGLNKKWMQNKLKFNKKKDENVNELIKLTNKNSTKEQKF